MDEKKSISGTSSLELGQTMYDGNIVYVFLKAGDKDFYAVIIGGLMSRGN